MTKTMHTIAMLASALLLAFSFLACNGGGGGNKGGGGGNANVTGVSLDLGAMYLVGVAQGSLTATVTPSGAANRGVTWETSDAGVVAVEPVSTFGARVTARGSAGRATITVKADDTANGVKSASCTVTVSPAEWTVVLVSTFHSFAINADNSLWAWGRNFFGVLGLGDTKDRSAPTRVGVANDWAAMSAGYYHTLAIKTDGSLWAWGYPNHGQLGLGVIADDLYAPAPIRVGADRNWAAVSACEDHSLAIKTDGSLWAWGANWNGQLGLGDSKDRGAPTRVGTDTDWAAVSAGYRHSLGLKTDGSLWAWGDNWYGQLGLGNDATKISVRAPTRVGTDNDWNVVSAGNDYTLAIKTNGSLWAWGNNYSGRLGLGNDADEDFYTDRRAPTRVGTDSDWNVVSAGGFHALAVKTDGSLWAWGSNDGELGLGDREDKGIPTRVGTDTDWAVVSAGWTSSLAIKTDGSLWDFKEAPYRIASMQF